MSLKTYCDRIANLLAKNWNSHNITNYQFLKNYTVVLKSLANYKLDPNSQTFTNHSLNFLKLTNYSSIYKKQFQPQIFKNLQSSPCESLKSSPNYFYS